MAQSQGLILVVSGPSGAGKSTVVRRLLALRPDVSLSVSHTTRAPRPGERDGVDYYFVDDATFDAMVERHAFVEWARVFSHRYGTSKDELERLVARGLHVILEIDWQGAVQVFSARPDAIGVFLFPPSAEELARRLRGRGTESPEELARRLAEARREIAQFHRYHYAVVNEDAEATARLLSCVLDAETHRSARLAAFAHGLLDEALTLS